MDKAEITNLKELERKGESFRIGGMVTMTLTILAFFGGYYFQEENYLLFVIGMLFMLFTILGKVEQRYWHTKLYITKLNRSRKL